MSVLLDAGPALTFLAVGQENVLIQASKALSAQLAVPENVKREIGWQATQPTFAKTAVASTWKKLEAAGHVQVLSDDVTVAVFAEAIGYIAGAPATQRVKDQKSLGEIMVIAHASVLAQQGTLAYLLINEADGRKRAQQEIRRLRGLSPSADVVPPRLLSTRELLEQAQSTIVGGHTWQQVYSQMRSFDLALGALDPG